MGLRPCRLAPRSSLCSRRGARRAGPCAVTARAEELAALAPDRSDGRSRGPNDGLTLLTPSTAVSPRVSAMYCPRPIVATGAGRRSPDPNTGARARRRNRVRPGNVGLQERRRRRNSGNAEKVSSGCESRPVKATGRQAGSEPCAGSGNAKAMRRCASELSRGSAAPKWRHARCPRCPVIRRQQRPPWAKPQEGGRTERGLRSWRGR